MAWKFKNNNAPTQQVYFGIFKRQEENNLKHPRNGRIWERRDEKGQAGGKK